MNDKTLVALAAWDLERNRDHYPAGATDKESCFYNGQIGNCGIVCPCFLSGGCPVETEIVEAAQAGEGER